MWPHHNFIQSKSCMFRNCKVINWLTGCPIFAFCTLIAISHEKWSLAVLSSFQVRWYCCFCAVCLWFCVLFCMKLSSLAVVDPRVGHTMDALSQFIPVLCHSDWLFHGESCPRLDVVLPSRAWSSSPACTWHCSLHYLFLKATPLFPHGVTIVC